MKIYRRICDTWDNKKIKVLKQFNIQVDEGFNCFNIEESETYFALKPYFDKWEVFNVRGVEFSKEEISNAKYVVLNGCNVGGYPMPDQNFGYLELTYDTSKYCKKCGSGVVQKDAFRLKNVPKHPIFQLTWVYDELFVNTEVYHKIFKPLGIQFREVKLLKGDKLIDSVVQLVIPETTESLNLHDYKSQTCSNCNVVKYEAQILGFFPIQNNPLKHIYKSSEYFGDGAAANKKIFISGELRDLLIKDKLMKNFWFVPCI